jgi:hypothetical protein
MEFVLCHHLKPLQRHMSYLCDWCVARYGILHGPWKTVCGPVLIKERKRHGFQSNCEVFIVELHEIVMHRWNIRNVYVFLDNNVEIEGK